MVRIILSAIAAFALIISAKAASIEAANGADLGADFRGILIFNKSGKTFTLGLSINAANFTIIELQNGEAAKFLSPKGADKDPIRLLVGLSSKSSFETAGQVIFVTIDKSGYYADGYPEIGSHVKVLAGKFKIIQQCSQLHRARLLGKQSTE